VSVLCAVFDAVHALGGCGDVDGGGGVGDTPAGTFAAMQIRSVADIVRAHSAERPDAISLSLGDRRVTWQLLYERARRVATGLRAAGVGSQDRVAFLDKNGIEHFEVAYGAALINAVCVDVNWRLAPPEVAFIVNDAIAKVLIIGPDFVPVLDAICGDLEHEPLILVIGGHPEHQDYDRWVGAHADDDPEARSDDADVAVQLYSSGTTGRPKGVMISNDNLIGLLPIGVDVWDMSAESAVLVAMPLFHIGGSGWAAVAHFIGARLEILREIDFGELVRLLSTGGVTHAFVVPAVLQFMQLVPGVGDADFSSLEVVVYGASPITEEVLESSVKLLGCRFFQVYGLTETTGAITHLPPADHDLSGPARHRLRSCGLPGTGVELRVVDVATGDDVAADVPGEILVRSRQVMKGYWNNPLATREAIDEAGWFRTGDVGYLDDDGYLYIHDRVKDMIVSGGENIYPAEVENVLMSHAAIADVAVIGVPSDKWGESPLAIVVLAPGEQVDEAGIIAFARERLATYKCPVGVDFTAALPRNPSGKILKKDLRAPYWEGRERQVN
jgi:long-chain acyl-CoA synthetase